MNLSKIKCGTCAFYQVDNSNYDERGAGQCRRNPDPHRKRGDEWCGEWRSEFPSPYEVTIKGETEDDLLKNLQKASGEPLVSRKTGKNETQRLLGHLAVVSGIVKGITLSFGSLLDDNEDLGEALEQLEARISLLAREAIEPDEKRE